MKKSRKRLLISSIAMLLVAMLALGTATFAWFTNNKKVTADGMTLTAAAAKGLQITGNNGLGTDAITDSTHWGSSYNFSSTANLSAVSVAYSAAPSSGEAAIAYGTMPAKTYYPQNVSSSGIFDGSNGANFDTWKDDSAYPTITTTKGTPAAATSAHFAAYQVGVRFTEDTSAEEAIEITGKVTIDKKTDADAKVLDYMRVAVLTGQIAPNNKISGIAPLKVVADEQQAKAIASTTPTIKAYSEKVEAGTSATWTFSGVKKSAPKYFTILVWFEGQDEDCIDANASLTGKVNVEFSYT